MKRESRALCASHLLFELGRTVEMFLVDLVCSSDVSKLSHKNKKPSVAKPRVFVGDYPLDYFLVISQHGGG
jgi:hypothetical protein